MASWCVTWKWKRAFRYALVARIKIMAGMDISEHRKPQDGKIDFARFGGSKTELRVVTVPTANAGWKTWCAT